MSEPEGQGDEAIGRPKEWREGRYQQPGKPVDESVKKPPANADDEPDTVSTPVTQKDYEDLERPSSTAGRPKLV